jgi:hypothetical protein
VNLITSGHFYLGERGHYYLALTNNTSSMSTLNRNVLFPAK